MKWRMHGANPEKLYRQFGLIMPKKVIDFSDNGNAVKRMKPFNINYENYFDKYPDDEVLNLRKIIAKKEEIPIENILFANGTNELIYIIASYYQNKTIAILHPTYSEYEKAFESYYVNVEYIYDFNDIKDEYHAVIVCNPNNPTGRYFSYEKIYDLAKYLNNKEIDLIIDEAYIDFMCIKHKTLPVTEFKNVYILRSLTKFFHISGLRIGYLLSHIDNINKVKLRQPTWSVNSIAQIVSSLYLKDNEFIKETKSFYEKERKRVFEILNKLGFNILDSKVNFFVIRVDDDESLIRFLLSKGIVVRYTRNFPGLDGKYIRITLKSIEENNLLINALREYIKD